MYYLHKLTHDDLVNCIIGTRECPDYDCAVTKVSSSRRKSQVVRDLLALKLGGIVYPNCTRVYTYNGVEYTNRVKLACAMQVSKNALDGMLRRYQSWIKQWPDNLSLTVDGVQAPRPRIIRGRFIHTGDLHYYDSYIIEERIFDNFETADEHYRKATNDDLFRDAVLGGEWPYYCGAIRDGKEFGDLTILHENME